jgi:hypothetical protein
MFALITPPAAVLATAPLPLVLLLLLVPNLGEASKQVSKVGTRKIAGRWAQCFIRITCLSCRLLRVFWVGTTCYTLVRVTRVTPSCVACLPLLGIKCGDGVGG